MIDAPLKLATINALLDFKYSIVIHAKYEQTSTKRSNTNSTQLSPKGAFTSRAEITARLFLSVTRK